MIFAMDIVDRPAPSLRLPRYCGGALLTVIAAVCLTLWYLHEGWFVRILRIVVGLSLPWIVAWLLPAKAQEHSHGLSRRAYWIRLALAYLGVIAVGIVFSLIWPFVSMVLMDSGLM